MFQQLNVLLLKLDSTSIFFCDCYFGVGRDIGMGWVGKSTFTLCLALLRKSWACRRMSKPTCRAAQLVKTLQPPSLPGVGLPLLAASVTFTSRWQKRRQLTCSKAAADQVSKQDTVTRTGVFVFSWGPRRREKHQAEKGADLYSFEINDTSFLLASIRTSEDLLK